jgi:hypothetical protein
MNKLIKFLEWVLNGILGEPGNSTDNAPLHITPTSHIPVEIPQLDIPSVEVPVMTHMTSRRLAKVRRHTPGPGPSVTAIRRPDGKVKTVTWIASSGRPVTGKIRPNGHMFIPGETVTVRRGGLVFDREIGSIATT